MDGGIKPLDMKGGKEGGGRKMYITILCIIFVAVSIVCLIIMKIIQPESFWLYFGWVVFINLLEAAFIYTQVFL